ncbi:hypothetical protein [Thermus oshimai]|nr:hypothetical protein [Thermus oshimai]
MFIQDLGPDLPLAFIALGTSIFLLGLGFYFFGDEAFGTGKKRGRKGD